MPCSFVTPLYRILEYSRCLSIVLYNSFAVQIHVYDHANRLLVALFRRSLVPSGCFLFVFWKACKSASGVGVADGFLSPCMSHICGPLIKSYSFLFILQNPVALVVAFRKPIQQLRIDWIKLMSAFKASKCFSELLFSSFQLLLLHLPLDSPKLFGQNRRRGGVGIDRTCPSGISGCGVLQFQTLAKPLFSFLLVAQVIPTTGGEGLCSNLRQRGGPHRNQCGLFFFVGTHCGLIS